ncbi:hypothetical protein VIBNISFn27_970009 [Vibrio nigripulchritudo SFn27]|uniref:Lipoprotein n=1 Tax=Vibrio nigripulchritudo TaxID=28173 RepID=U4KD49_9VIBR|nr:hypothetical protein [Vibrio nigripulchritudo]CCN81459.1 hypothetical protein VIBNIBLFn1_240009 [Vibrio nigripulchritudo BLFn1]CCN91555.1 hypothetical protein VIBNISFn27_970009 [Vibrio nigripulchritudo SFn27]CCN96440.1 hypothetical protein VIBNIENn2_780009 [Vibrio nigripulchritudo ENn2]CCO38313.1 hypothetical protein VIBNISFn135_100009 [Vibrio nigripulchritudo SFn135]CCO53769.1 hypothetical protein VIBNIWn13_600009 [Vibrio nigripulchritudo Wn13]
MLKQTISVFFVLLLSACGAGSSSNSQPVKITSNNQQTATLKVFHFSSTGSTFSKGFGNAIAISKEIGGRTEPMYTGDLYGASETLRLNWNQVTFPLVSYELRDQNTKTKLAKASTVIKDGGKYYLFAIGNKSEGYRFQWNIVRENAKNDASKKSVRVLNMNDKVQYKVSSDGNLMASLVANQLSERIELEKSYPMEFYFESGTSGKACILAQSDDNYGDDLIVALDPNTEDCLFLYG